MIAKKLSKVGNSQALLLDKTLLKLISADVDSTFRISVDGSKLILEALSQSDVDQMALKASSKIRKTQKNVFRKLAK